MQKSAASSCSSIVEHVYSHPDVTAMLSWIKPQDIQQDIRQEMALALLTNPCDKLEDLFARGNLIRYAIRVCYNMAVGNGTSQHNLSSTYRRKQLANAVEYLYLQQGAGLDESLAHTAEKHLQQKMNADRVSAHEARIFRMYIELGSGRKVAEYFGIPKDHVRKVLTRVKTELKCKLLA